MKCKSYLYSCFFIYIVTSVITTTINNVHPGSMTSVTYPHPYTFAGTAGNTLCKVQFSITGVNSYLTIMYASTTDLVSPNILSYFHKDPKSDPKVDLQNAILGQDQTVWIDPLSGSTNIFIKVMVSSLNAFTYSIVITESPASGFATSCTYAPAAQSSPTPYCSNCGPTGKSGVYCAYYDIILSNNTQRTMSIASGGYAVFTIPSSSGSITVNYGIDQPLAQVFFQFKTFSGQIAGLVNIAPTSSGGYAVYLANIPTSIYQNTINSGSSDISVTAINQGSSTINFTIWYTTQQSVNILIIILGVLGGVLLIVLIIAGCCIVKRMRNPSQMIHPNSSALANQIQIQQNMLTAQEIEIYFPSVSCRIVFTDLQSSSLSLNNNKQNQDIDKDCVICLCPVDVNELMKITYCRHIFHSHCLIQWFKKQRNCPYCRQEYSKTSTIQHYQNLLKDTKKNILAGPQLAKAILMSKVIKSSVLVEQIKD